MTRSMPELHARLTELDREIAAYPRWGAALAAMDEERRDIRRELERRAARPFSGPGVE